MDVNENYVSKVLMMNQKQQIEELESLCKGADSNYNASRFLVLARATETDEQMIEIEEIIDNILMKKS